MTTNFFIRHAFIVVFAYNAQALSYSHNIIIFIQLPLSGQECALFSTITPSKAKPIGNEYHNARP